VVCTAVLLLIHFDCSFWRAVVTPGVNFFMYRQHRILPHNYIFRTYNSAMCCGIFKYKTLIVVPSQLYINVGLIICAYNYFIWSMIQRGSDTSFTNLWSLLLYIQSLLHYIENAQENKKNTILSYNIAENSKRVR
jgi:hypothetical protein